MNDTLDLTDSRFKQNFINYHKEIGLHTGWSNLFQLPSFLK